MREEKVKRLDYIGSKYKLLDWISENILRVTDNESFDNLKIADIFSGTGIVSYHFRKNKAIVLSNDSELYSFTISKAMNISVYSESCEKMINSIHKDIEENKYENTFGYITKHYSPYENCERKFFTIDNAKIIDYIRQKIEIYKKDLKDQDYIFLLASLIVSADNVSNVPAVYGCFLKNFKKKALKKLEYIPVHKNTELALDGSASYNIDVLSENFINEIKNNDTDVIYMDPPYNERQYSKNYFPLNMIAKSPQELLSEPTLGGKTGIPQDCFISSFCKKSGNACENAFRFLCENLKARWIFISYNSESIIEKEKMLNILNEFGKVSVIEKEYKRFKNFRYNKDVSINEFLFCLEKN